MGNIQSNWPMTANEETVEGEANFKDLKEVKADHKLTTWRDEEEISFIWEIKNFELFRATREIKSEILRFKNGEEWMIVIQKKDLSKGYRWLYVRREEKQEAELTKKWVKAQVEGAFSRRRMNLPTHNISSLPHNSSESMVAKENLPRYKVQILGSESQDVLAEFKNSKEKNYLFHIINDSLLFDSYLIDGDLKIFCQLFLPGKIRHKTMKSEAKSFVGLEKHLEIMKVLMTTGTDADVHIVAGTKSFKAHKIILKSHSPVFLKMFETEMLEATTNILTIEDFGEEAIGAMLSYIYTGTADNFSQKALELLQISEKYAIDGLKEDAQSALIQSLSQENAAEYLHVADIFNASRLKRSVLQFMLNSTE